MEALQGHIGAMFGQTDLIEKKNGNCVVGMLLVTNGHIELILNRGTIGHGAALVRDNVNRRVILPKLIWALLPLKVRGDDLEGESLLKGWLEKKEKKNKIKKK